MKLVYPACFYPNKSGGYTAVVPDLLGCVTEGDTFPEAMEMAVDAASGWVLTSLEDGEDIPRASEINFVKADEYEGGFVSLIVLDMDSYAEKYGKKAVRKNCTIPAWLNTKAEAAHINFSAVLQEALQEKLIRN
ncbi:MAG: type II toxin-antitoxin system HicB family antitoxin [Clostridiales bacterium]|nr:type II toxin-antitoxin system HicB family antitoxin [Clostridiales bacterium]MCD8214152.1 type II toxin-antitoxin system HicB family antitoxin [Clostridiales bacterium]